MKTGFNFLIGCLFSFVFLSCSQKAEVKNGVTAADILGNPKYQAISYGGYRAKSRDVQPTIEELKEDLRILEAMNIKVLRTYNVQFMEVPNLLEAISQMKSEDPDFEMYVMMGAWIDCENAWTDLAPNHEAESPANAGEIERAVKLANQYPDIVKMIAVGNEAMVRWATSYFVQSKYILKWVNHLQDLKKSGGLPADIWISSSDDFSSWGGGDASYHTDDLVALYKAVDFVSMHTYPYHNTHYNPDFWLESDSLASLSEKEKIDAAMIRARDFAKSQYDSVRSYMKSIGVEKSIHIGETGWATVSDGFYGPEGSRATDEYKQALYYQHMREWTNAEGISCFYFEAFDEQWKDAKNPEGSENHFGLINLSGQAKYPLWDMVDEGRYEGLTRGGEKITKTYNGNFDSLMQDVLVPPSKD
ncbi:glycosyl hydrolase family 17 protein [Algoriphagus marinus]|uniref:glycosyl hydrolase family 17 protein n=1 Tax=Algoriphagus marinus TaxID=1925762 RepID=UPI00094BB125|nr:glycosyl hydrolase family 17 protein [Algoriphagus marinus]